MGTDERGQGQGLSPIVGGGEANGQPSEAASAPQCPDDCPMCLEMECLLCESGKWSNGTLMCDHKSEQRHRSLSTIAARHRARVQERLNSYDLADAELRSAVQAAARDGLDVIEVLGVIPDSDNTRQLIEHEMDMA